MALTQLKTGAIADDAVTTDKLANAINTERTANTAKVSLDADSVTGAKIADDAIDSEHITDGSIDNAHLADDAVGVAELSATGTASSSTFLRGDNSWAAVTSTTINTNGDNRVLTGTGTANTIQGEPQLLFDPNGLLYIKAPDGGNRYFFGETGDSQSAQLSLYNSSDEQKVRISAGDGGNAADTYFTGGNVGIGTNTPTGSSTNYNNALLHIHQTGSSSAGSQVKLTTGASGAGAGDGTLIAQWSDNNFYINNQESGNIQFYTGGGSRARLDSDGLKFGSDTAAANALDDYEEGSWTPTVSQGVDSISGASCRYVKIGNVCTVSASFTPTGNASSDAVIFGGLPYTSHSSHAGSASIMHNGFDEDGSAEPTVHAYVGGSSTNFYVYYSRTAGVGFQNATGGQVHSHQMIFNITYPTA